ncbi:unnamed protein product [Soboliphyme baturini]|uniref:Pept_C1 domain-containing protein n=1 Tax=Soboliphyme baturini TaxID=241478 RepID=A0A183ISL6_9BILA|nr:unnamed protein product [Soboliphyme baturini]
MVEAADWHGLNDRLLGMSKENIARMYGTQLLSEKFHLPPPPINSQKMRNFEPPTDFDARQKWSTCESLKLIRDQSNCGSCWAVSSASVMSDRICIASNGNHQPYISDEFITACCRFFSYGCQGGSPLGAFLFWQFGIPTGGPFNTTYGCQPYTIYCNGCKYTAPTPPCSHECIPEYHGTFENSLYYGTNVHWIRNNTMAQYEIMNAGPIDVTFLVYTDFMYYKGGIYQHVWGKFEAAHAVRLIGWGIEENEPYWLVTNSWGTKWGMNGMTQMSQLKVLFALIGLFKIRRGINECDIEENMLAGDAKL